MSANVYSEASRANKRDYYIRNREAILALRRAKYASDPCRYMGKVSTPEQVERRNQRAKAWRLANPDRYRATKKARYEETKNLAWERNLKSKYGITAARYEELLQSQHGKCAICRSGQSRRRLNVDHCHQTGVIRGLLCDKCNKAIGLFGDSIELINKVIEYLAASGQRSV